MPKKATRSASLSEYAAEILKNCKENIATHLFP
jgi:hypothetical protein